MKKRTVFDSYLRDWMQMLVGARLYNAAADIRGFSDKIEREIKRENKIIDSIPSRKERPELYQSLEDTLYPLNQALEKLDDAREKIEEIVEELKAIQPMMEEAEKCYERVKEARAREKE